MRRLGRIVEIIGARYRWDLGFLVNPAVKPDNAALLLPLCGLNVKEQTPAIHPEIGIMEPEQTRQCQSPR
jgi:hypothetical protein